MLSYLGINNFAIIEELELDLRPGFTVLTGETGAGKSIIIDAVHLLLGERAEANLIRSNTEVATVEGIFLFPDGPEEGVARVLRGGSWDFPARVCRAAIRASDRPGYRYSYVGFRVVFWRQNSL